MSLNNNSDIALFPSVLFGLFQNQSCSKQQYLKLIKPALQQLASLGTEELTDDNWRAFENIVVKIPLRDLDQGEKTSFKTALQSLKLLKNNQKPEELLAFLISNKEPEELVLLVLELCSEEGIKNFRDIWDQTLLHLAVRWEYLELVKKLLDKGIDMHAKIKSNNESALHLIWTTSSEMQKQFIHLFKDAGAKFDQKNLLGETPFEMIVSTKNSELRAILGWTDLHHAAFKGNHEDAMRLIEAGADPLARDMQRRSVFNVAWEKGNLLFLLDLLKSGCLSKEHQEELLQDAQRYLEELEITKDSFVLPEKFINAVLQTLLILQHCGGDPLEDLSTTSTAAACFEKQREYPNSLLYGQEERQMFHLIEQHILARTKLSHVSGLDLYEGFFEEDKKELEVKAWVAFEKAVLSFALSKKERYFLVEIAKAHQKNLEKEELFKRVKAGKLIAFKTGYETHDVRIIIFGDYLIVANGGPRDSTNGINVPTLVAYRIDAQKITKELLEFLCKKEKRTKEEFLKLVYRDLPKDLSEKETPMKDEICKEIERISPKEQKFGTCAYYSIKAAQRAALALGQVANGTLLGIRSRMETAKKQSKEVGTYERAYFLNDFIKQVGIKKATYLLNLSIEKLKKHVQKHGKTTKEFLLPFHALNRIFMEQGLHA